MPRVMIRCPRTDRPIPTGIAMNEQSFQSSDLLDNAVACPECGGAHVWSKEDAYVEQD